MPASRAATSSRSPRAAVAPRASTVAALLSLRASALTRTPRALSALITPPPTKPEPPVTNARFTSRNLILSEAMSDGPTIRHADGRVELRAPEELHSSPLYSDDLAPVPVAKRTWNTIDYAALWVSMAHCIPTYALASFMISQGLAWWQA